MALIKPYLRGGKRTAIEFLLKRRNLIFSILICFLSIIFVLSSIMIVKYYLQSSREEKAFAELAASVMQNSHSDTMMKRQYEEDDLKHKETQQYTEYITLYEKNSDFVGWLHISNTNIDYPVMCTPDEPEYYLRRAFNQSYSQSGTPFIGKDSTIDSDMFIIYGHNMKNGTMFGTLDRYMEKTFWQENSDISFTTVAEERKYEVFAALETRILYREESGYCYYEQAGDLTKTAFEELVQWLADNALYDTGITPEYGEQIVILSTCSYHEENGRFIIAARRVDSEE